MIVKNFLLLTTLSIIVGHSYSYPLLGLNRTSTAYNFEPHFLNEDLEINCNLIILTETEIEFHPITTFPYIISKDIPNFIFHRSQCFILILPNFIWVTNALRDFIRKSVYQFKLVIIIPKYENYVNIKDVRKVVRGTIKIIDKTTTELIQKYHALPSYCGTVMKTVQCQLEKQVVRIGYAESPYLKVKDWDLYKSTNTPIPPIILSSSYPVKTNFTGFEAKLLQMLIDNYEMTFIMLAPKDFVTGDINEETSELTDRYLMLLRKEVDLVIPSQPGNIEREMIGTYSYPIHMVKFTLASSKIIKNQENWNSLILSFELMIWICIVVSMLCICTSLWSVMRAYNRIRGSKNLKVPGIIQISASAYTSLIAKPTTLPSDGPAAFIIGAWMICSLILQCAYVSNFMATLSAPVEIHKLDTLENAWEQKKHLYISSSITVELFFTSNKGGESSSSHLLEQFNSATKMKLGGDTSDGLIAQMDHGFVVALAETYLRKEIYGNAADPLDYYISPKPFLTVFAGWLFAEDASEIRKGINSVILMINARGLFKKWEEDTEIQLIGGGSGNNTFVKYHKLLASLRRSTQEKTKKLNLYQLQSIFYSWTLGIVVGALIGLVERITIRLCRNDAVTFTYLP